MRADDIAALAPIRVLHMRDGGALPADAAIWAVLWQDGAPAGLRLFLPEQLPVAAPALAEIAAATIGAQRGPAPEAVPPGPADQVSVVVCTRDRPEDLGRCLAALRRCVPAPREIVVVDNAPRDRRTAETVAAFPGVRYIAEDVPGLSNARNAGVRAARGEIVAFTDDDVEVLPDWIARLAAPFHRPEVACVTGLVLPGTLDTPAACLFELHLGGFGKALRRRDYDAGHLRRRFWQAPEVWKIGAGANMAIRRRAFAEVGLFDPRLGAGAAGCSEDSEFWFRLLRAGLICHYDPAVVVEHFHRGDMAGLRRQMRAYMAGHVVALLVQFGQDRRPCHILRILVILPLHYARRTLRALVARDRTALVLIGAQVAGLLRAPAEALRRLRHPGPPPL